MAGFGEVMALSASAAADLSAAQYHILRWTGAGTVNIASHAAATAVLGAMGVLQNKPGNGQAATVGYFGESKVVAGGALTVNTLITNNGSGRAAAAGSGDIVVGRVLDTAGADGDVVRALIFPTFRMIGT